MAIFPHIRQLFKKIVLLVLHHLPDLIFEHTLDFVLHGFGAGFAEMDSDDVGHFADLLDQRRGLSWAVEAGAAEVLAVSAVTFSFSIWFLSLQKQLQLFSVSDNLSRRRFSAGGVILPEVLPAKEDRGAPFQEESLKSHDFKDFLLLFELYSLEK